MKIYINNNLLNNAEWQYKSNQVGIITLNSNSSLLEITNQFANTFTLTIEFTDEKIETYYECLLAGIQKENTQYLLTINFSYFERNILNEVETTITNTENAILELASLHDAIVQTINSLQARIDSDSQFTNNKIDELTSLVSTTTTAYNESEFYYTTLKTQVKTLVTKVEEQTTLIEQLTARIEALEHEQSGDTND